MRVLDDAPEIMREVAERPFRTLALEPGRVIGTYDGGSLTDVGFVGWLQALPPDEHNALLEGTDEDLRELARRTMQNDILFLEAKSVGTDLTPQQFDRIKTRLEQLLERVRNAMRVDSVMARAASPNERRDVARDVLDDFLTRSASTLREMWIVPPFLARKLRREADWQLNYAGLNRAIRRAVALRAEADSTGEGGR
jgi:hypothetical protein